MGAAAPSGGRGKGPTRRTGPRGDSPVCYRASRPEGEPHDKGLALQHRPGEDHTQGVLAHRQPANPATPALTLFSAVGCVHGSYRCPVLCAQLGCAPSASRAAKRSGSLMDSRPPLIARAPVPAESAYRKKASAGVRRPATHKSPLLTPPRPQHAARPEHAAQETFDSFVALKDVIRRCCTGESYW